MESLFSFLGLCGIGWGGLSKKLRLGSRITVILVGSALIYLGINLPAMRQRAIEASIPPLESVDDSARWEGENGVRYAAGTVRNNSDTRYGYVQAEINLFDELGAQVGSTLDNVNNLDPGATWKFRAPVIDDRARSFTVERVWGR